MYDPGVMVAELRRDEGWRYLPYIDSVGVTSIGCGRNLTDGISDSEIAFLLGNDIAKSVAGLDHLLPWWRTLDDVRQRVLVNMTFNLGIHGLLLFVHFLEAMKVHDWTRAAAEMKNSRWWTQIGDRAQRLQHMVLTGEAA